MTDDLDPFQILPRMRAVAREARRLCDERIAADPTLGPDGQRWSDDPVKQADAKARFLADRLPPGWRREGTSLVSPNGIREADLSQVKTIPIADRVAGYALKAERSPEFPLPMGFLSPLPKCPTCRRNLV